MDSPAGPGSPATGGIDGAQLALRMVNAAEAAAQAAQAAVVAAGSPTAASSAGKDWFKMLPRPPVFEPKSREEELTLFRDWMWQLEQYLVALDPLFSRDLVEVRQDLTREIDMDALTDEEKKRSGFLFGLLASLLRGRPLMMLKSIAPGNGLDA